MNKICNHATTSSGFCEICDKDRVTQSCSVEHQTESDTDNRRDSQKEDDINVVEELHQSQQEQQKQIKTPSSEVIAQIMIMYY